MKRCISADEMVAAQLARRKAIRDVVAVSPRKRRKAITKSDVDAAVTAVLDDLDREFRRLSVQFPKYRAPYDIARTVVRDARSLSKRADPAIDPIEIGGDPPIDAITAEFLQMVEDARRAGGAQ